MSEESVASGLDDMIRKKNNELYDDIEDDERDAYTRCNLCGVRIKLKQLRIHKEVMHGKAKS